MPTHAFAPRDGCAVPACVRVTKLYTAFEAHYTSDFYFGGEVHDFWELVVIMEGVVGITADHQIYSLRQGQAVLHQPMEFHRIWAAEGTDPTVIVITFSAQGMAGALRGVRQLSPNNTARVYHILELIKAGYDLEGISVAEIRQGHLLEAKKAVSLLEYLLMSVTGEPGSSDAQDESAPAQQYRQIMAVLSSHVTEPLTVAQLADLCHMSQTTLKRTFSKYSGMGVMHYFMELKIRHAMTLLRQGEKISTVSEKLGFENQNYFSTVFRRLVGMRPSEFRRTED